ncbi:conserved hypothetical protein [Streptococcus mitis B6]|uniref:Phage protein n=1 Tax=Streptococcus mitis (strain B6) TaxID=365659 RepID=D3H759_STRM6|nr:DUF1642 domain-containing protein [Streptococcus mitis]QBX26192.1 hypothetical protein Javan308_0023 [Streptococcus phage Javan308]CBJ21701.1 conserved hypothetical protein [Streptococcus mitis B6]
MNNQELIERIEGLKTIFGNEEKYIEIDAIIEIVSKLDKPEKVKVPQFVVDLLEFAKLNFWDLEDIFEDIRNGPKDSEISKWFYQKNNMNILARAWLDGYEVEKEKRYLVRIKGVEEDNAFLNYYAPRNEWFMDSSCDMKDIRAFHTRKQLEDAGFGWVFDCPGIEIEEVE